mmetsp:Transcript_24028/g.44193  ORF Transcript_24028/g.44193 Transcript_24028/m.44193 type:complete len:277 (+) Transcript_24028:631-1461(+)
MRCACVFLADHAHDFGQFFHQVAPVLQPPCGVDHQQIRTVLLRLAHRFKREAGGVGPFGCGEHGHARPVAPDLQLFHCGGAEGVACRDHYGFACGPELAGQFADRRGLARAVYTNDKNHLRRLRIERQRFGNRFHDARDFAGHQFLDLLHGQLLADASFGHVGRDPQRRVDPHVGRDQQLFELFEHVIVERPAQDGCGIITAQKTAQDATLGWGSAGFRIVERWHRHRCCDGYLRGCRGDLCRCGVGHFDRRGRLGNLNGGGCRLRIVGPHWRFRF